MAETDATPTAGRARRVADGVVAVLKTVPGPLSHAANLVAMGALIVWAYRLFGGPGAQVVMAAFVCSAGAVAIGIAFYLQYQLHHHMLRSGRAHRLARAQPTMASLGRHLSRATAFMAEGGQRDEVQRHGDQVAKTLGEVFTTITGSPCRATVKQMYVPQDVDTPAVRDLFRSHYVEHSRSPDHIDWVRDNSDFEDLLADGVTFWISNDIKREFASGYKNSHITTEQVRNDELPYRSAMVVRIAGPGGGAPVHVAGFLCIDSENPGIFRRDFDVSTAKYVAHGMYSILRWFQVSDQADRDEDGGE